MCEIIFLYKFLFSHFISAFCGWIITFLVPLTIQELTGSAFYSAAAYAVSYLPAFQAPFIRSNLIHSLKVIFASPSIFKAQTYKSN